MNAGVAGTIAWMLLQQKKQEEPNVKTFEPTYGMTKRPKPSMMKY